MPEPTPVLNGFMEVAGDVRDVKNEIRSRLTALGAVEAGVAITE